jgi:hypothetical protein
MFHRCLKAIGALSGTVILLQIVSQFKVNCIFGSQIAIFSGINFFGPLLGVWLGMPLAAGLLIGRAFIKSFFMGTSLFTPLVYHIPTICASTYFLPGKRLIKIVIPLVAIAMFIAHPVGRQAFWYSSFWLIPLVIAFIPHRSVFLTALGSTFTAHAVGSVLWLYWVGVSAETFALLMPIVPLERMVYALGMVIIHRGVNYFSQITTHLGAARTSTIV